MFTCSYSVIFVSFNEFACTLHVIWTKVYEDHSSVSITTTTWLSVNVAAKLFFFFLFFFSLKLAKIVLTVHSMCLKPLALPSQKPAWSFCLESRLLLSVCSLCSKTTEKSLFSDPSEFHPSVFIYMFSSLENTCLICSSLPKADLGYVRKTYGKMIWIFQTS